MSKYQETKDNYIKEKVDSLRIYVPKGKKTTIQEFAKANGFKSLNSFVVDTIEKAMKSSVETNSDDLTIQEKSSPSELTENEQKIISLFKLLSESQQGQLIGRAEMMAEYGVNQNNNYTSQIAAFGGDNTESEISEENLKKALKALNELDKKETKGE